MECKPLFEKSEDVCLTLLNKATKSGATPLHCACSTAKVEIAKVLLENGASVTAEDDDGKTPHALAKEAGFLKDVLKMLDPKGKAVRAMSPLARRAALARSRRMSKVDNEVKLYCTCPACTAGVRAGRYRL